MMNLFVFASLALALISVKAAEINWKSFRGMCDASAVELLNGDLFVAGNDEDNALRIFSRVRQDAPIQVLDFSGFYRLPKKSQEIDLEGSARLDDRIYWISSHGANASGKYQPSRHRFFATQIVTNSGVVGLRPAGQLYAGLVRDLIAEPSLARLNLAGAAHRPPKTPGALNIEALAATPEKQLLIGFRNPVPDGKALIVPLQNPAEVVQGKRPRFGQPMLLDLKGQGIRSMISTSEGYLIVSGSFDSGGSARLYRWSGGSATPQVVLEKLPGNPEGIALVSDTPGRTNLFVINDDGNRKILGTDCKKVKNPNLRTFRGYEISLPL